MIETGLKSIGFEKYKDYDENTISMLENMLLNSSYEFEKFKEKLNVMTISDVLNYSPRLTQKAEKQCHYYLSEYECYDELIADIVIELLSMKEEEVLYFVDSLYRKYYLIVLDE